jgi:hypothetical protein
VTQPKTAVIQAIDAVMPSNEVRDPLELRPHAGAIECHARAPTTRTAISLFAISNTRMPKQSPPMLVSSPA